MTPGRSLWQKVLSIYKVASARISMIEQGSGALSSLNVLLNIQAEELPSQLDLVEQKMTSLKDINNVIKEIEAASAHSKDAEELLGKIRTCREQLSVWVGNILMDQEAFDKTLGELRECADTLYPFTNSPAVHELSEMYDCSKLPAIPKSATKAFWMRCVLVPNCN